ncbi:MAG: sodium/solute symporter [Pirellulales bacterium]|nr:sodium/solute symporter [Pirellulales bacterium]
MRLPRPLAYGVSLSSREGVVCIGGGDADRHYSEAFLLQWRKGKIVLCELPRLPQTVAFACGAVLEDTLYLAGGLNSPHASTALKTLWAMDLKRPRSEWRWERRAPWPGPARMLAVAGAQDGSFFLISGVNLVPGSSLGESLRVYLNDTYRYTPGKGWQTVAATPQSVAAAPSPAMPLGQMQLAVLGGDDGAQAQENVFAAHRGFSRSVLAYQTVTDTWTLLDRIPESQVPRVTTPLVPWGNGFVVPSGEVRPGVRSPGIVEVEPIPKRATFGWINYLALFGYLFCMVGIGFWCSRHNKSTNDFFRGGQRIPWWAAGLSIYATMLSSITYMAIPAKAFATDWSYYFQILAIPAMTPLVVCFYLPFYRQLDVTSAYEYLEKRFNLAVRWFGSVSFMVLITGRMAIVLFLPALALATVSSLDIYFCIVLMGALCILYTVVGGIEAVVWTDVVQTVVLLGGALAALILIAFNVEGGLAGLWQTAHAEGKFFERLDWSGDLTAGTVWVIFIGYFFSNFIPYTAQQDVVQRYITTADTRRAARSIWTNALLALPGSALFFAVGTALYVFYKMHPGQFDPSIKTDAVFPLFIVREMPVGLGGLVVAGIFAAAQSTLSGSLNSLATCWVTDFHRRLKPDSSDRANLRLARWVTLLVGAVMTGVACLMVRLNIESLWDSFIALLGLAGGALAGLFALGIFTRRANGSGALCGAFTSIVVLYLVKQCTELHFFLYGGIGIFVCVAVGWCSSWFLGPPAENLGGLTIFTRASGNTLDSLRGP